MGKKIKFKYYEIENTGKVLVYIDYVDRDFFNNGFDEEWKYNNITFNIFKYSSTCKGHLEIKYTLNGKINSFYLAIGIKENYFIINKNEMKLFKDLENIVYNDNKILLSSYLENNKYYYVILIAKYLKYDVDVFSFDGDDIDKNYFLNGNMFRTKKEVEEIVKKLNNGEITIKEVKEGRKNFIKKFKFD